MVISITNCGVGGGLSIRYVVCCAPGCCVNQDFDFCWNGHTFNPTEPWKGCTLVGWSTSSMPSVFDATSNFDASSLSNGHELVIGLALFGGYSVGNVVGIKYSDNGGMICQWSYTIQSAGGCYLTWAGMGIRDWEFDNNSNFCFHAFATGVACVCCGFNICNLAFSCYAPGKMGSIWVSGENIWYIDAGWCRAHCMKHDGSTYGSGETAGHIWVPNVANAKYLSYVDEYGDVRNTQNGDTCGWRNCDGQPSGGHTSGHIWAENNFNDSGLMFINYCGCQVRIGNGFRDGNCY